MPSNREQALIDIGISSIPVALTAISLALGTEAAPAAVAIAAGVGAGMSLAAGPVLFAAAVAVAVADDKTISDIMASVGLVGKVTSPGFVFSIPIGVAVTPQNPSLFAGAFGPAVDIFAGVMSPSGFDQFQNAADTLIGFGTWASDVQKLAASSSSGKSSASTASTGRSQESGGYSSDDSGSNAAGFGSSSDVFSHDRDLPGGNETLDSPESQSAPDSSIEKALEDTGPVYNGEFGARAEAEDQAEAQNDAADASPYSDEETQAAEDAAAAAQQDSNNSSNDEDQDNDDNDDDGDED